jgi:hypothetical protein
VGSLAGLHSQFNQDSHACRAPDFFSVADGVGGGCLGEVASAMLVRAPRPKQVAQVLVAADEAIAQRIAQEGSGPGAAVCAACGVLSCPGESGFCSSTTSMRTSLGISIAM